MELLIIILIMIAITIAPVMLAAKALGARNAGFLPSLLAVVASSIVNAFTERLIEIDPIAFAVSFIMTAIIFSVVLGARLLQSAAIAVLAVILQFLILLGLAELGFAMVGYH